MPFVADLHIHSHLSRATSRTLDLEHLHATAQRKGITVLGTGDFTHPRWFSDLREKLVPAEPGLFALRPELATAMDATVPAACRGPVRFLLQVEISNIYKRGDRVRKVHNLVFAPDFECAARITGKLAALGNVESDGRPILGLDSRDLLEIVLEASPDAFLIPAHVWTPWFSALGAQSGFDAVAECYADLAEHVFAVETGLSSDPAMNWRLSQLDRYALVSSSDAHSLEKLGREANLFACDLSYFALRDALRGPRAGFLGTVEFFPEEGKYHLDGHRKCGVVLPPADARARGGLCPVCDKRLTGGVMGRVESLADRPQGFRPPGAQGFRNYIPLGELIGEVMGAGPASGRVRGAYERLLGKLGPELALLGEIPIDEIDHHGPPLLGEALRRMRAGAISAEAGYDGEYGVIRVFDPSERRALLAQRSFGFAEPRAPAPPSAASGDALAGAAEAAPAGAPALPSAPSDVASPALGAAKARVTEILDPAQQAVVEHPGGPLCVLAGPGTGKTRTIVARIAHLIERRGVSARSVTAIAFTRKAAAELRDRLTARLGPRGRQLSALTFHALGLELLRAFPAATGLSPAFSLIDEPTRQRLGDELARAHPEAGLSAARLLEAIAHAKGQGLRSDTSGEPSPPPPPGVTPTLRAAYAAYQRALSAAHQLDFEDLVLAATGLLGTSAEARAHVEARARYLFVDELQDVQPAQLAFVRALAAAAHPEGSPELCVVGDPDQAIYGFRGASPEAFALFARAFPGTTTLALSTNYRSAPSLLAAAQAVIAATPGREPRPIHAAARARAGAPTPPSPIERLVLSDGPAEAEAIATAIERLVGGTSLTSFDTGRAVGHETPAIAFHDIAILTRTTAQQDAIGEALERATIPYRRVQDAAAGLGARPAVARLLTGLARLAAAPSASIASVQDPPLPELLATLLAARAMDVASQKAADLLATLAAPYGSDLPRFLREVALLREMDLPFAPQKVALLTLHAAKGLEWPVVFIAGCERGLLPLELPGLPTDLEEERRLLYVGMTRAREQLILTAARRRTHQGRTVEAAACPFLEAIPPHLLVERAAASRRKRPRQLGLF
jgi:DNA helicase-2/ATP-dependent DNA helicase PcrA